jgi:hypothetical protein
MAEGPLAMLIISFQSLPPTTTNTTAGLPRRGTTTRLRCKAPTHFFNPFLQITSRDSLHKISSVLFQTPESHSADLNEPKESFTRRRVRLHGLMLLSKLLGSSI